MNTPVYTREDIYVRLAAYPEIRFTSGAHNLPIVLFGTRTNAYIGMVIRKQQENTTFVVVHKMKTRGVDAYYAAYEHARKNGFPHGTLSYSDIEKYLYIFEHDTRVPLDVHIERLNKLITALEW